MGRRHGIAVSNGTGAIDVAVEALGIGVNDEVIMPTLTIISCVLQIVRSGAKPVLVDCDPFTFNMDPEEVERKITSKTKAIMIVHLYGLPVKVSELLDIAKRYNLLVIEDAAEMHGQTYNNFPCGSFGDISTFSFYPNKHITTGEGGMVLTNNDEIASRCRSLRNLCFQPENRFVHEELGWNLRMSNLQAAVGVAQLERLDEFVQLKRNNAYLYNWNLKSADNLQLPVKSTLYSENIYWVYSVILKADCEGNAVDMMRLLGEEGIGTRPFFCPLHLQPALHKLGLFGGEKFPIAERLYKKGFYLPSGLGLTKDDIERVSSTLLRLSKAKQYL